MTAGAAAAPDVLSGSPDTPPRRWPRVLLVLALLVGVGVAVEQWERQRQREALLAAAADAERVVGDARTSLAGLVRYSGGTFAQAELGGPQRQALLDTFAADTRRFVPRVAGPRQAVADVRVLPWDDELRRARAAYLARLDDWTSYAGGSVDDPESVFFERRVTSEERSRAAAALTGLGDDADEVVALLSR